METGYGIPAIGLRAWWRWLEGRGEEEEYERGQQPDLAGEEKNAYTQRQRDAPAGCDGGEQSNGRVHDSGREDEPAVVGPVIFAAAAAAGLAEEGGADACVPDESRASRPRQAAIASRFQRADFESDGCGPGVTTATKPPIARATNIHAKG
jgi:hypothetical protein